MGEQHAKSWPHLRWLADFMDIGTVSSRWKTSNPSDSLSAEDKKDFDERAQRTNVCLLEYCRDPKKPPKCLPYTDHTMLDAALENLETDRDVALRLFVVEDLSRVVIESLGSKFNVEPDFFSEHLLAYAWHNVRDPWKGATPLEVEIEQRRWLQIRFPRARYFETSKSYGDVARKEEASFNVLRRADDDENKESKWDIQGALTSLMRSKASLWMKKGNGSDETVTAILLLDPTIQEGHALWKGYRNWEKPPSVAGQHSGGPEQKSLFDDFVHWAQKPECFPQPPLGSNPSRMHLPMAALLHLVGSEWLLVIDYIKARLNIIDWELAYPKTFVQNPKDIDGRMRKLHAWRRFIPVFREMLSEMLLRVFHTSTHIDTMRGGDFDARAWLEHQPGAENHIRHLLPDVVLQPYKRDFALALDAMEEFQKRLERLTQLAVQTAIVDDSRRSMADNRNLHRLTWLATLFLPLGFIATFLSMTPDVAELANTMRVWASIAVPSAVITLGVVFTLSFPKAEKKMRDFPWVGQWKPFQEDDDANGR
ncbi:hypothetical protein ACHAQA_005040 [Verticillium albo-atrum]